MPDRSQKFVLTYWHSCGVRDPHLAVRL